MYGINEAMEIVVKTLRERRKRGERLSAPGDSGIEWITLDWFSDAPDSFSQTLSETGVHVVPTVGNRARGTSILGVDGSSRRFSTPYGSLALATVALTLGPLPLVDYPPLGYEYPISCGLTEPFIAAYATLGVKHELIATESPAGHPYEPPPSLGGSEGGRKGYALADIAHEVRTKLETLGLKIAMQAAEEGSLILLDGPLYQRPWRHEVRRSPYLKDDWRELTRERVEALREASKRGIAVVGSVKRLDKSRLLVKAHGSLSSSVGFTFPPQENDQAEVIQLVSFYVKKGKLNVFEPLLVGPLSMKPSEELKSEVGVDMPELVYSYVVLPQLPYSGDLDAPCGVLRLEALREVYDSENLDVFFRALEEGVMQGLPLPPAQAFADARCRQTSRALFEQMCRTALMEGVELTYDTWLVYNRAGEEYAE